MSLRLVKIWFIYPKSVVCIKSNYFNRHPGCAIEAKLRKTIKLSVPLKEEFFIYYIKRHAEYNPSKSFLQIIPRYFTRELRTDHDTQNGT